MAKQKVISRVTRAAKLDRRTTTGRAASGRDLVSKTLSREMAKKR